MKRILGLAGLLGHALGAATGIQAYGGARIGRGKRPVYGNAYYGSSRPNATRWWHDLEQPGQCARLQAAKDKRERKAEKRTADTRVSYLNNDVGSFFVGPFRTGQKPNSLNPFYVNK